MNKKIALGIIILILVSFASLFLGRYSIEPREVIEAFSNKIHNVSDESFNSAVIWDIRIPRVLLNILVGFGLSVAGTSFQGIFKNNLVSPDILGVSSGAGFGAALALLLFPGSSKLLLIISFSIGILSVAISYLIAKIKVEDSILSLVLSGVIVGSFFNALTSFIKLIADTESTLPSITYWLMGSFTGASMDKVFLASVPIISGIVILFILRWRINILSLGDEDAKSLGVNPKRNRVLVIMASTLITSGAVMVSGIIGWIGMLIPNICREIIGADNRYLIPFSGIVGAIFLVLVDLIARSLTGTEIPIGILTAILGAPMFIYTYSRRDIK